MLWKDCYEPVQVNLYLGTHPPKIRVTVSYVAEVKVRLRAFGPGPVIGICEGTQLNRYLTL